MKKKQSCRSMKGEKNPCGMAEGDQQSWPIEKLREFYNCNMVKIPCSNCPVFDEKEEK